MSDSGTDTALSQKRDALSDRISRASRPPWLWPIRTMRRKVGSRPSGSTSFTMSLNDCRSSAADSRIGLLVEYVKTQNCTLSRSTTSLESSLYISPQRAGLEVVPWISTTGTRPGQVGLHHEEALAVEAEIGREERAELRRPHRCSLERISQRRRRIELERHRVPVDVHRRGLVGRMELEPAPPPAIRDTGARRRRSARMRSPRPSPGAGCAFGPASVAGPVPAGAISAASGAPMPAWR